VVIPAFFLQELDEFLLVVKRADVRVLYLSTPRLYRLAVDAAYNAAELCAKGLLLLKLNNIPTSHGGIIGMFGELFVKTEVVPNQIGRGLNKNLQLRNKARYDCHALITKEDAEKAIDLAKKLVAIFKESYTPPTVIR
jgi:uncharacterized protein (UPF0332 family)